MTVTKSRMFLVALLGLSAAACRHVGQYVWVQDLPASATREPEYVIVPGDVLAIRVWNDDTLGGRAKVRSDGKISLPFVADVGAAGMSPNDLAHQLELRLTGYVNQPHVTVALEEERLLQISVLGEVAKPGVYDLVVGSGVLQAIASAGGLTQWASKDRIFVLRRNPDENARPLRIRFTHDALSHAERAASAFRLRRGDVVVVE